MTTLITLSSKGQLTLPVFIRKQAAVTQGDRLEVSINPETHAITLTPVLSLADLSTKISSYAQKCEPVHDVNAYYQEHRTLLSKAQEPDTLI
jgi:bifunctional DNA-binding transcriptional regulator/antitoxin component of YhaV-PrlF toxin-antitoxin module